MHGEPDESLVDRREEFMRLFTAHQRFVYFFIRSMVLRPSNSQPMAPHISL